MMKLSLAGLCDRIIGSDNRIMLCIGYVIIAYTNMT